MLHGGQFETLEGLDWKFVILVRGGKDHISYVPYLLITKRGRDVGVAWHGLRGRQDLFHSGRCLHLNFSTSPREVRTRLCLFCHHQIGEDCWDS